MIKFQLLASGSKGNCCLIENETTKMIIDCGCTQKYLKQCFASLDVHIDTYDALFITHNHKDHISAINLFKNIPIYTKCCLEKKEYYTLDTYEEIVLGSLHIKEIPLSHDVDAISGFILWDEDSKLVYVTDTGYIKEKDYALLKNADLYIFESNHDTEMLMACSRPMYVKQRILSDRGHLCNEESAYLLSKFVGNKTKQIVLAHISEEANTMVQARNVCVETLKDKGKDIQIEAAPQFGIVKSVVYD